MSKLLSEPVSLGSGERWDSKATTSSYLHLDIRCWQREGFLVVGRSFVWDWWNVEVVTSMKRDEPNLVCLSRRNEARQSRSLTVWIEWTPCNYGGARAWFICPRGCGRRVAILYNRGHFACRHCHQLAYESQQESRNNRALHRAQEIRMKLGGSASLAEPFPAKPKGMHWSRYLRLYRKAMAREEVFLGAPYPAVSASDSLPDVWPAV